MDLVSQSPSSHFPHFLRQSGLTFLIITPNPLSHLGFPLGSEDSF